MRERGFRCVWRIADFPFNHKLFGLEIVLKTH